MPKILCDPASGTDLLQRARRGDPEALRVLYDTYAQTIFAAAFRLLQSYADAEDVVHDLFVGLPEALHHYQDRGKLGSWLRTIATRSALMRLRGRRREQMLLSTTVPDPPLRPDLEASIDLRRALGALNEPLRTVFILKEIEGYSHAEIAALLGIRRGTSEVRFHRALRALKTFIRSDLA